MLINYLNSRSWYRYGNKVNIFQIRVLYINNLFSKYSVIIRYTNSFLPVQYVSFVMFIEYKILTMNGIDAVSFVTCKKVTSHITRLTSYVTINKYPNA